ncbi:MAG TPA: SDR family NAD(P)-dependent oxidoreductase [Trebonia sp.]|nr:SDR family NAD(P)-dependent oxidoreductase [Trebonia sp.]
MGNAACARYCGGRAASSVVLVANQSFLVTGASSGIGRACVNDLAAKGARVWATVRTDDDEKALKKDHPDAVTVLRVDLADSDSVIAAGERVCAAGPLNGLVNNAAWAVPAPLELTPVDHFRRQVEVSLIGQFAMTRAMLPALRQARAAGQPARIIMIGSVGDRIARPMFGAYCAAKFGLVGLSDTLRAELAPSGIAVALVEPGAIATPIWDRGLVETADLVNQAPAEDRARYERHITAFLDMCAKMPTQGSPPEQVAAVVTQALTGRRPRARYLVGKQARMAATIASLPSGVRYALAARL